MTDELIEITKIDFFIRLPNKDAMLTVFSAFYAQDVETVIDDDGNPVEYPSGDPYFVPYGNGYAIDQIGDLMRPTGEVTAGPDGEEIPVMEKLDGYHLNVRLSGDSRRAEIEAIDAEFGVMPANPLRVFA